MPSNLYRVQIDGGWREVELIPCHAGPPEESIVRDVLRGEILYVDTSALVPVVPRSEWEKQEWASALNACAKCRQQKPRNIWNAEIAGKR